MKIAIVDMGTNTFHLMLVEVSENGYTILSSERRSVKIGKKGINEGQISAQAWNRALFAIKAFKKTIENHGIEKTYSTATSAIRNARNGQELVDEIYEQTGIPTEIISGEKEAKLILSGVRRAMKLGEDKHLVMDIGGGSIEFIIANQYKTYWLKSFEIGGQRLIERFHNSNPISKKETARLTAYFNRELKELVDACELHHPKTLVGCSGIFDTLSDIYCENKGIHRNEADTEYPLDFIDLEAIFQQVISKTREERLDIKGMIPMRVDMIVVACLLIRHVIQRVHLTDIRVSSYALKEGVLLDVISNIRDAHINPPK